MLVEILCWTASPLPDVMISFTLCILELNPDLNIWHSQRNLPHPALSSSQSAGVRWEAWRSTRPANKKWLSLLVRVRSQPYSGQDSVTLLCLRDDGARGSVIDSVVIRVRDGILLLFKLWSQAVRPLWSKQRGLFKYPPVPPVIIKLNFWVSGQTHVRIFLLHSSRLETNLLCMLVKFRVFLGNNKDVISVLRIRFSW